MTAADKNTFTMTQMSAPPGVGLDIRAANALSSEERIILKRAGLNDLAPVEAWTVTGSNKQLSYSTHGVFRFFGKFPPPIAHHLISSFSKEGDWILDPMAGSGTTAVEALTLGRSAVVRDVSPLSTLLCRVKTTHVASASSAAACARVERRYLSKQGSSTAVPVGLRNADHWFLPQTISSLARLRDAIEPETRADVRDLLLMAFVSTVRRVSKATTQQGRLFLDVAKAKSEAWPTFADQFQKFADAVDTLPPQWANGKLQIECLDAKTPPQSSRRFNLAITHPPYFNNYRYSSINSLELAWLGVSHKDVRSTEIRESFKIGKPEKLADYLTDLSSALVEIETQLKPRGVLALMIGDTVIRGSYIDVIYQLLQCMQKAGSRLTLERIVLRIPQFTEASWVASQRRLGNQVGVALNDFILLFTRSTSK